MTNLQVMSNVLSASLGQFFIVSFCGLSMIGLKLTDKTVADLKVDACPPFV